MRVSCKWRRGSKLLQQYQTAKHKPAVELSGPAGCRRDNGVLDQRHRMLPQVLVLAGCVLPAGRCGRTPGSGG